MEEFPSLFQGIGDMVGVYTIQLEDDAKPFTLSSTPKSGHSYTRVSEARVAASGRHGHDSKAGPVEQVLQVRQLPDR